MRKKDIFSFFSPLQFIGIFSFLIYITLASFFYLERVMMLDNAYQLFEILRTNSFYIPNHRFGVSIIQSIPLFFSQFNFTLEFIAQLFTLSYPLVYFLIFLIISFVFKNNGISILYLIYHFLINTHSFYWPHCELVLGNSVLMLWMAITLSNHSKSKLSFEIPIYITAFFLHPLVIFYLGFFLIYAFDNKKITQRKFSIYLAFTICCFLVKALIFTSYYDTNYFGKLIKFFLNIHLTHKNIKLEFYIQHIIVPYLWLFIFMIWVSIKLFIQKNYFTIFILLSFTFLLCMMIQICFSDWAENFYLEGQINIISLIVGLPFVYSFSTKISLKNNCILHTLMLIFFIFKIVYFSHSYSKRIDYYAHLIENNRDKKMILDSKNTDNKTLKMIWASSYEVWLLSTIKYHHSNSIIILNNPNQYDWALDKNKSIFTEWGIFDYSELNPKYFILKDRCFYQKN